MAGIVFFRTRDLARIRAFYLERIGMEPWIEQPQISILRHGNLLVGFQAAETADIDSLLTLFYPTRAEVDAIHAGLGDLATSSPRENPRYRIYNFFARDPDGRRIEFQTFLHPLPARPDPSWA